MRNNAVAVSRGRFITCPGDPIHIVYNPELQKDGSIKLVEFAKENTDEIIHSFYESTTLEVILSRFANGDTSALNRYQPIYADLTQAPKTLAEALQTITNSRSAFEHLPVEVKQQFDNDFNKWLMSAGTPAWMSAMQVVMPDSSDSISDSAASSDPIEKEV